MLLDLPLCELAAQGLYRPAHGATAVVLIVQFQHEVSSINDGELDSSYVSERHEGRSKQGHDASKRALTETLGQR